MDNLVEVRITADGTCFIDDEFFPVPPGASLNESVLQHLMLEAAAMEAPVSAAIHDEQANYSMAIQVNADGTSHPLDRTPSAPTVPARGQLPKAEPESCQPAEPSQMGAQPSTAPLAMSPRPAEEPFPPDRPFEPLVEPHRGQMQAALDLARSGDLDNASRRMNAILAELTATHGMNHTGTLAAATVQGDLAHLAHDYRYSFRIWISLATTWERQLGPVHPTTFRATGNAVGCWRKLTPSDALATSDTLIELLSLVPVSGGDTARRLITRRVRQLRGQGL